MPYLVSLLWCYSCRIEYSGSANVHFQAAPRSFFSGGFTVAAQGLYCMLQAIRTRPMNHRGRPGSRQIPRWTFSRQVPRAAMLCGLSPPQCQVCLSISLAVHAYLDTNPIGAVPGAEAPRTAAVCNVRQYRLYG